ncbi:LOW QUALITY PROTEIN: uncharacterized protein LOC117326594 [Pecten maximus]|uniref:LOW QUALITY PROTEIN: uncharacterized protein LOC117326594 n=1 Tax=Pecten maximus TaxID=6579 RepID=UPI0014587C80|nr:LOW QUALITY PROTEIN: uncharacterized protein LOC117326594 [Pecten maximus]
MTGMVCLLVLMAAFTMVSANIVGLSEFKRVCYFTNWAQYRGSPMTFTPDNIDPFLCTHIIYAFSQLNGNNMTTVEWNDLSMYSRIVDMKTLNPSLKVVLAVGGYSHGVDRFSAMASSDQNIDEFATSVIKFLRKYRFDGLDLDWEFPAYGINSKEDKFRFTRLVQILRVRFDTDSMITMQTPLLLSAAVSAGKWNIDDSYEVDIISQGLDFINLMSYDFHGSWEGTTGHTSPLYPRSDEQGDQKLLNQEAAVHYWISLGAPPDKIVMGMALYGRTFTLANTGNVGLGAPTTGPGNQGPYTEEPGTLAYYEVCKNLEKGWTRVWNDEHKVPYAFSGNQWVGYDDVQSFTTKAEFIRATRLAGSMVWSMDFDDFNNVCGNGVNPLMSVLKNTLEYQTVDPITLPPIPVTTTTTTPKPITSVTTDNPPDIPAFKRVCYFTNWAQYRGSPMTFTADNIDPFLCTHIIYAFSQLNGNDMTTVEWNDLSIYKKVMDWKVTNSALKVLLAVGGYNHGVKRFSDMVSTDKSIEQFAANTILFLRSYGFDGLDLDWEYPCLRTSEPNDKFRFTRLTQILRREFDLEGTSSNRPTLLLSAAVAASQNTSDAAYEIDIISQNLDFINLMSYDFHGTWDDTTGHNSPLYARQSETTFQKSLNQDAAVQYWISGGTPPHKLVMGLALYGRSFTLASANDVGLNASVIGGGSPGQYTRESGYMGYYEMCDRVENKGWTRVWDNEHQIPFAFSGNQWVGYDDVESFTVKAHYIKSRGLGGSMVWAMDLDDFNNVCGLGINPMMSALKKILSSPTIGSTITPTIAPPSARPTTDAVTRSTTTPHPGKTTTAAVVRTTTSSNAETTSNSQTSCAPTLCPDSTIVPSACDAACVFQCCNGSHVEYCCNYGYVWNDRDKNCQKTVQTTTTPRPIVSTQINCDAPSSCTHGQFSPDPCDDQCFYNCGHGISYHQCCATGRVWDNYIKDCNYPELIQDDLNCRPKVCPPFEFLPEPCVPHCYYQCSSTGLDIRFCCNQGTIWDDSIKACNYPPAMDEVNAVFNIIQPSTTPAGKTLRSGTNTLTHQINFIGCGISGISVSFSPQKTTFPTQVKSDHVTTPQQIIEKEKRHIRRTMSTTKEPDQTNPLIKQTQPIILFTKQTDSTESPTKLPDPTKSQVKETDSPNLPMKQTYPTKLQTKSTDITRSPTKPADETWIPTKPADKTWISTKPTDKTWISTKPTDITKLPTKPTDKTWISTKPADETWIPTKPADKTWISTKPTDKTWISTKPTDKTWIPTKPTDVIRSPTKPTDIKKLPTKPTDKTWISTKPTDVTRSPTKPTDVTKILTKPTDKTWIPTKPTDKTLISTKPTDVTRSPTKPTDITKLPTKPTDETWIPTKPTDVTKLPTKPTDKTWIPTKPTDVTKLPTKPTDKTWIPTKPTDIKKLPTEPTDKTWISTKPTDVTKSPTKPTDKKWIPTKPTDETWISTKPTDVTKLQTKPTDKKWIPTKPTDKTKLPTKPTDETWIQTKPTDKTKLPTKPNNAPISPTKPTNKTWISTKPTDVTKLPTKPTDVPISPTKPTDKTWITTKPTDVTKLPTKPTDVPISPTKPTDKTWISTKPTDVTKLPTKPTDETWIQTKPTDKSWISTKPTDKKWIPTKPTDKTWISTKPTDVTRSPTKPTDITKLPTKPTDKTWIPTKPTDKTWISTKPTDKTWISTKPTDVTRSPTKPTDKTWISMRPTDKTWIPTKQTDVTRSQTNPTDITKLPTKPTDKTWISTKPTDVTKSPTKPDDKTWISTKAN